MVMANPIVTPEDASNATNANNTNATTNLLTIPLEVRLEIYDHLFTSLCLDSHSTDDGDTARQELRYATAILYTSKQILGEASKSFLRCYEELQQKLASCKDDLLIARTEHLKQEWALSQFSSIAWYNEDKRQWFQEEWDRLQPTRDGLIAARHKCLTAKLRSSLDSVVP